MLEVATAQNGIVGIKFDVTLMHYISCLYFIIMLPDLVRCRLIKKIKRSFYIPVRDILLSAPFFV